MSSAATTEGLGDDGRPAAASVLAGSAGHRSPRVRVCAVSFKVCWQDEAGHWMSSGGFSLQMSSIASLFDEMVLVVTRGAPQVGALALPAEARVIPLRQPEGSDLRRKLSVFVRLPYYLWMIARAIRGADVVHVPLPGDIPFLALFVALAARKRTIVRYGGAWHANARTTMMNRITVGVMRIFAGGRNVMIAAGDGAEAPARNVEWLFSTAVTRAELARVGPIPHRGLSSPPRLVCLGRLSPEKGVANLVRAVALLVESGFHPLPLLTIIGDGPSRREIEALVAELHCEHIITLTGQLDRAALSDELARADLCVHPSLTESLSKAWLDAMGHGLPVLTSDVGSAPVLFGTPGERGWLVPPGEVDALAAALRQVLRGQIDWPALRQRCRAYVEERTLEVWTARIGEQCARQWGWRFEHGRLRA